MTALRSIVPATPVAAQKTDRLDRERRRLLSSSRLRMAFTLFVVALILALSGLIFVWVSRIFDTLTPKLEADLEWKARRGASELVHATELGIVTADEREIKGSFGGYDHDPDIMAIVVTDMAGKVLATHGSPPEPTAKLFAGNGHTLRKGAGYFASWGEAAIEGGPRSPRQQAELTLSRADRRDDVRVWLGNAVRPQHASGDRSGALGGGQLLRSSASEATAEAAADGASCRRQGETAANEERTQPAHGHIPGMNPAQPTAAAARQARPGRSASIGGRMLPCAIWSRRA